MGISLGFPAMVSLSVSLFMAYPKGCDVFFCFIWSRAPAVHVRNVFSCKYIPSAKGRRLPMVKMGAQHVCFVVVEA